LTELSPNLPVQFFETVYIA